MSGGGMPQESFKLLLPVILTFQMALENTTRYVSTILLLLFGGTIRRIKVGSLTQDIRSQYCAQPTIPSNHRRLERRKMEMMLLLLTVWEICTIASMRTLCGILLRVPRDLRGQIG